MTTLGTRLFTWAKGRLVGIDQQGNRYYVERRPRPGGRARRWVIYRGAIEASRVPPEWHSWLHHTTDAALAPSPEKPWVAPHLANLTGSDAAWVPPGHDFRGGHRSHATGDYEPWRPS